MDGVFEDILIGDCDFDMETGEDFCYIGAERVTREKWIEWYHGLESLPSCEEYSFTEENIREYIR